MLIAAPNVLASRLPYARVTTALAVVGVAMLTSLSAQWAIPLPGTPVPITGQTFAVLLGGAVLGSRAGAAAQALYLLLGGLRVPMFAFAGGASGWKTLAAPSAGYLVGFVVGAALIGRLAEMRADRSFSTMLTAFLAGSSVIYLFGVVGLMVMADMSMGEAFAAGVYPFVVGDLVKAAAAGVLTPAAWKMIGRS